MTLLGPHAWWTTPVADRMLPYIDTEGEGLGEGAGKTVGRPGGRLTTV